VKRRSLAQLRDGVEDALDRGEVDQAVRWARESLKRQPDAEGWYLLGVSLLAAGEGEEGTEALNRAVEEDAEHVDAWVALADDSAANLDFASAQEQVGHALRVDPVHPAARRLRAALRERGGDTDGAARDYLTAALADPDGYPLPTPLDDDTIAALTESVLDTLHPSLRAYLTNVPILVEEVPSEALLEELPDAHPFELLGCFSGRPLTERGGHDTWSAIPPTITLFRLNLSRLALDREELERELRITLLHEIGHFLGLDEEDLAERGLD
jgi:predicted Zn-dependent protease with MMP-like domain